MKTKLTISIVSPSLNQEKYIKQLFNSLLKQNLGSRLEYIFVDGISIDKTQEIVNKYVKKFNKRGVKFIYIQERDKGQSDAINKGWRLATGDIVTYINCDDYYRQNSLLKVLKYFETHPEVNWVYTGSHYIYEGSKLVKTIQPKKFEINKLLRANFIIQPSCFYRKSFLDQIGYLNTSLDLAMDYDLWVRFAKKSSPGILKIITSSVRIHHESKTSKYPLKHFLEAIHISIRNSTPFSLLRFILYLSLVKNLIRLQIARFLRPRL